MDKFDIGDNEIRIIGSRKRETVEGPKESDTMVPGVSPSSRKSGGLWRYITIVATLLLLGVCLLLVLRGGNAAQPSSPSALDSLNTQDTSQLESVFTVEEEVPTPVSPATLSVTDTMVNDIPMRRFTLQSAKASLQMAVNPPTGNPDLLLAAQAADVRSDNNLPAGTFVLNGELISKSHSKYGFCAIIGHEITLGRQTETPFLERAIEQGGSFFRQYSLVSDGQMMSIPPKGKAQRRSLCLLEGAICVIESLERESYHDFSQALVDMGVTEAISLVGGSAILLYRNADGEEVLEGSYNNSNPKHSNCANYIVFTRR